MQETALIVTVEKCEGHIAEPRLAKQSCNQYHTERSRLKHMYLVATNRILHQYHVVN